MDGDLLRALSNGVAKRWRFVSLRGLGGRGVARNLDVLAIRKDTSKSDHHILKAGDLFDIILIQMKGGTARAPAAADIGVSRTLHSAIGPERWRYLHGGRARDAIRKTRTRGKMAAIEPLQRGSPALEVRLPKCASRGPSCAFVPLRLRLRTPAGPELTAW
jgi:hypothetical protein